MTTLPESCKCGDVRLAVRGSPSRIGICHRTDCRQESGSAFTFFGVWPAANFETKGETSEYDPLAATRSSDTILRAIETASAMPSPHRISTPS
jgi:hypothetical protein